MEAVFVSEYIILYGLMVFCFVSPVILTVMNIINLIKKKKILPRVTAMLTVWVGALLYTMLILGYDTIYTLKFGAAVYLLPVCGVLAVFVLLIALWNYPAERLLPTAVNVFRLSFLAANLLHIAFAVLMLFIGANFSIFLLFYVYHLNLVLISVSELKRVCN